MFTRATFKQSWYERDGKWQRKCLVYEYRGREYEVYVGDCSATLAEQHRMGQNYIDRQIELEEIASRQDRGDAIEDFNFFWDYVEGNIDEDGNRIAE